MPTDAIMGGWHRMHLDDAFPIRHVLPVGPARVGFRCWAHWARFFIAISMYISRYSEFYIYSTILYRSGEAGMDGWPWANSDVIPQIILILHFAAIGTNKINILAQGRISPPWVYTWIHGCDLQRNEHNQPAPLDCPRINPGVVVVGAPTWLISLIAVFPIHPLVVSVGVPTQHSIPLVAGLPAHRCPLLCAGFRVGLKSPSFGLSCRR